ncbi:MAG: BspA family leucine-rich repeat surface protein [Bacteroidales bacterium]
MTYASRYIRFLYTRFIPTLFFVLLGTELFAQHSDGDYFVLIFNISSPKTEVHIPLNGSIDYDFHIDWGDGYAETITGSGAYYKSRVKHTYSDVGSKTVKIIGMQENGAEGFPSINFKEGSSDNAALLAEVKQWGKIKWKTLSNAFMNCSEMIMTAIDLPILTEVKDMSNMFQDAITFNQDISNWDVSSVTDMTFMFQGAKSFNQDISDWDVSSVTSMANMFQEADAFNNGDQALDWGEKTVNVVDMSNMFQKAIAFNQDISSWNVSNVVLMEDMFYGAKAFNQDIGNWDVSSVTNMKFMFEATDNFNQDISDWDVSKVTTMEAMFRDAIVFNNGEQALDWGEKTANVISMEEMFCRAYRFNQDIGNWSTDNVVEMEDIFNLATDFDQDLSNWNIDNVTNMKYMFDEAANFNNGGKPLLWGNKTDSVTDMSYMFRGAVKFNVDISSWNIKSVRTMEGMFYGATAFNNGGVALDWSNDTTSLTTIEVMFRDAPNFNQKITWNISKVTTTEDMFWNASSFNQDISDWGISSVKIMKRMFNNATAFNNGGVALDWGAKTSSVINMEDMFYLASSFNQDVSSWDVSSVRTMRYMFQEATAFNNGGVALDWGARTNSVENMEKMFEKASSFNQDLSSWDVTSVEDMSQMFKDASAFNNGGKALAWGETTASVVDMEEMFCRASSFNQNISSWNVYSTKDMSQMFQEASVFNNGGEALDWGVTTSSVTTMEDMFYKASLFNQDVSSWDVSGVTTMRFMFQQATAFNNGGEALDWGANTKHVTTMEKMFYQASSFNQDISSWDLSSVTNMFQMFYEASAFNNGGVLDNEDKPLTWGATVGSVTTMKEMFYLASSFNQDISTWDLSSVTDMQAMFSKASSFNNGEKTNNGEKPLTWGATTSLVTTMEDMFYQASSFNQDVSDWDLSSVTSTRFMFQQATAFNNGGQPLDWGDKTQSVTDMRKMFQKVKSFDQDISSWNISSLTTAENMFEEAGLSVVNYDALLIGWNSQNRTNVKLNGGSSVYCAGADARENLITNGWEISDGGPMSERLDNTSKFLDEITEICDGEDAVLETDASKDGVVYWLYNTADNTKVQGVDSVLGDGASIRFTVSPSSTESYYLKGYSLLDAHGDCIEPSVLDEITVNVNPPSVAGVANPATSELCTGAGTSLYLDGPVGNIQWQRASNSTGVTPSDDKFSNVDGATASTLETGNLVASNDITYYYYRAIVKSGECEPDTSTMSVITIYATSVGGTASAEDESLQTGSQTKLSLSGSVGTIQWQVTSNSTGETPSDGDFSNVINNGTNIDYYTDVLVAVDNNITYYFYRAIVTNGVCGELNSTVAKVSIHPASTAGTSSAIEDRLCDGSDAQLKLENYTGTIQWQRAVKNTSDKPIDAEYSNIEAATEDVLTIASPVINNQTTYYCYRALVTSGESSGYSNVSKITVYPASMGGTSSSTTSEICSGTAAELELTGHSGTIQWQQASNNTGDVPVADGYTDLISKTSSELETDALSATDGITYYFYRAVVTNGVCMDTSTVTTVTAYPESVGGTSSATTSELCTGSAAELKLTDYIGDIQWQQASNNTGDNPADVEYADLDTKISSDLETAALNVINNDTTYYFYRAVVTNGVCSEISNTTMVTVYSREGGESSAIEDELCTGSSTELKLEGFVGEIQWQRASNSDGVESVTDDDYVNLTDETSSELETDALSATDGITYYFYRAVVTNGVCMDTSTVTTVTAYPESVGGTSSAITSELCTGSSTEIKLEDFVGEIQWQRASNRTGVVPTKDVDYFNIDGATSDVYSSLALDATLRTTYYYYRAIVTNGVCSSTSTVTTVTAYPASVGGQSAALSYEICDNSPASLKLKGEKGTIQWQQASNNIGAEPSAEAYTNLEGKTVEEIETDALSVINNDTSYYFYRAVVTNSVCTTDTSDVTRVTVYTASVGGRSSATTSEICSGTAAELELANYTGDIQWQQAVNVSGSDPSDAEYTNLGKTASKIKTVRLGVIDNNPTYYFYRAVVKNGTCDASTSDITRVTVYPESTNGTSSTETAELCAGSTALIKLSNSIGDIQWQQASNNTGDNPADFEYVNLTDETSSELETDVLSATDGVTYYFYRAVVTNGVCSEISNVTTVKVVPASVGGTSSATTSELCTGTAAELELTGYSGTIQWQQASNDTGDVPAADGYTDLISKTSSELETDALSATDGITYYFYRAVVTNGVCMDTSTVTKISVSPESDGGSITPETSTVASGTNSTVLTLKDYVGDIVRWESSASSDFATPTSIDNTESTYTAENLTATTYYRALVKSGECLEASSNTVVINVDAPTAGGSLSPNATAVCIGDNSTELSLSGHTGTVVRWESSTDDFANIVEIDNTGATYTAENLTVTTSYRAVVQNGVSAEATSEVATISVSPESEGGTATATAGKICNNTATEITLSNYVGEILYWEMSKDNGITWETAIPDGVRLATYTTANLTNNSKIDSVYQFRAIVQSGVCESTTSSIVSITVLPKVVAIDYYATISDGKPIIVNPLENVSYSHVVLDAIGTPDQGGTAVLNDKKMVEYTASKGFVGEEKIKYYIIVNDLCQDSAFIIVTTEHICLQYTMPDLVMEVCLGNTDYNINLVEYMPYTDIEDVSVWNESGTLLSNPKSYPSSSLKANNTTVFTYHYERTGFCVGSESANIYINAVSNDRIAVFGNKKVSVCGASLKDGGYKLNSLIPYASNGGAWDKELATTTSATVSLEPYLNKDAEDGWVFDAQDFWSKVIEMNGGAVPDSVSVTIPYSADDACVGKRGITLTIEITKEKTDGE